MEQEILQLLRQARGRSFSLKEVSKLIDRKQFRENPDWARPLLQGLLNRRLIEKDNDNRYCIPVSEQSER